MKNEAYVPRALKELSILIDKTIEEIFKDKDKNILEKSMAYSALAKGKRLRPVLAILSYKTLGGTNIDSILKSASALELIHTYSLIHDDLPAMDNDDFRRGVLTNHKVFGEAMAILAGDALQTLGFELLATYPKGSKYTYKRLRAVKTVAKAIGKEGMALGQALDISSHEKEFNSDTLLNMHYYKTGKLIQASVLCGGIWAGGKSSELRILSKFGKQFGILFQLVDDILDFTGTKEELGKTPLKDLRDNKKTLVTLWGLENAKKMVEIYLSEALWLLSFFGDRALDLREITHFIAVRRY